MSLISSAIPNFLNGISQQPAGLRLASQGERQENGLSTVSSGLQKRPPTQHIRKLLSVTSLGNCFIHTINRDTTEQYTVVISNGSLRVFDMQGTEQGVTFRPGALEYLATTDASTGFSAVTIADYTIIANKGRVVPVPEDTEISYNRPRNECLIHVRAGAWGQGYGAYFKTATPGSLFLAELHHKTPEATAAGLVASDASPAHIAQQMVANAQLADTVTLGGFTITRKEAVIYAYDMSFTRDFVVDCEDGSNNAFIKLFKGTVQNFTDLPSVDLPEGFTLKVAGDEAASTSGYYVTVNSQGKWVECRAPNIREGITEQTMPFILVRLANGDFEFKSGPWERRKTGDLQSNPDPSFAKKRIQEVFFYRNRLGIISDEGVVFSEAGNYWNFYRTTLTQLLDSDPIDIQTAHNKVSLLKHAVPYNRQLFLFSEQTQFIMDTADLLTPRTASLKVVTEFPCHPVVKPVVAGKYIYFASAKDSYSTVREFFPESTLLTYDSTDLCGHVPSYLPAGISKLTASADESVLCALTTTERNALYVYKYYWGGAEKIQSSWSKFTLGDTDVILSAEFIQGTLYLVIERPDGVFMEKMGLSVGSLGTSEPYKVHLDRKVSVTGGAYSDGYTTLVLPYVPSGGSYAAVTKSDQSARAGVLLDVIWDGTTAKVKGNLTGVNLLVGRRYSFVYELSQITLKVNSGGAVRSDTEGRLQLRKVAFDYTESGYFTVEVTPAGRATVGHTFSGKTLGDTSVIGGVSVGSGKFSVPVMSRNIGTSIVIKSDHPMPCTLTSATWEGTYVKRSQSV